MEGEISVLQVEKKIRNRVKRQMEKTQREYYLNEQMKAIQRELGEGDDGREELSELEQKVADDQAQQGSARKGRGGAQEAAPDEPHVGGSHRGAQLSRLDAGVALGQAQTSEERSGKKAEQVLDRDHFGLEKVKERIIEHLAVQRV
jgi:ATP-dependent Lon protease